MEMTTPLSLLIASVATEKRINEAIRLIENRIRTFSKRYGGARSADEFAPYFEDMTEAEDCATFLSNSEDEIVELREKAANLPKYPPVSSITDDELRALSKPDVGLLISIIDPIKSPGLLQQVYHVRRYSMYD